MSEPMTDALVLTDGQGRYYLVACAPWEPLPVPAAQTAALEQALDATDAAGYLSDQTSTSAQLRLAGIVHLPAALAAALAATPHDTPPPR